MSKVIAWVAGIVLVAVLGGGYYYLNHRTEGELPPGEMTLPPPEGGVAQVAPAQPGARHPLSPEPVAPGATPAPLPFIEESDTPVQQAAGEAVDSVTVGQFLIPQNIVRRIVVTVDNLPRPKLAVQMRPVVPTPEQTLVSGDFDAGEVVTLRPENFERYKPFVTAAQAVDVHKLASVYRRFYPLFQSAYEDLGYPGRYFNDRVVEVIDHLLEAPELPDGAELVRPKVFYEFKDPALESRSAGHKWLMRMGNDNAAVIKSRLRELRAELVR